MFDFMAMDIGGLLAEFPFISITKIFFDFYSICLFLLEVVRKHQVMYDIQKFCSICLFLLEVVRKHQAMYTHTHTSILFYFIFFVDLTIHLGKHEFFFSFFAINFGEIGGLIYEYPICDGFKKKNFDL